MDETKNAFAQELISDLYQLREGILRLSEDIDRGPGGREVALARTNLEQAIHWLYDAQNVS